MDINSFRYTRKFNLNNQENIKLGDIIGSFSDNPMICYVSEITDSEVTLEVIDSTDMASRPNYEEYPTSERDLFWVLDKSRFTSSQKKFIESKGYKL